MKLQNTEKIAKLFIEDKSSLELLLMLNEEGSTSIEEINKSFNIKTDTIKNLSECNLIYINNDKIDITTNGNELASDLITKIGVNV